MNSLVLTQTGGILKPFAIVLGFIMNYIDRFLEIFGISNVAVTIILFTFVVNVLLIPLTIRQQRFTKMNSLMNPELQKIRKKYENRKDEKSMRMMQAETQAVYDKYGASPMTGCLPLLIQLPILLALYRVIYNVPAYVDSVKQVYESIAQPIMNTAGAGDIMANFIQTTNLRVSNFDITNVNKVVDALYLVKTTGWSALTEAFAGSPNVVAAIAEHSKTIISMNSLPFGLNITDAPVNFANGISGIFPGILIPILSGLTQWINMKLTMKNQPQQTGDSSMAGTMNSMNTMMPLISVFFAITLPAGMGIYWIANAAFRALSFLVVDKFFNNISAEDIIEANKEKAAKKAEKRGAQNAKLEEYASMKTKDVGKKSISDIAKSSSNSSSGSSSSKKVETDSNQVDKKSISGYAHMVKRHDD